MLTGLRHVLVFKSHDRNSIYTYKVMHIFNTRLSAAAVGVSDPLDPTTSKVSLENDHLEFPAGNSGVM